MTDFRPYSEALEEAGEPIAPTYRCTWVNPVREKTCGAVGAAFTFADVAHIPEIDRPAICGNCLQDFLRLQERVDTIAAAEAVEGTWESEAGVAMKAERNRRVESWAWANQAGSPLTAESQADCAAHVAALHRLTIDFAGPEEAEWPPEPAIAYA